MAMQPFAILRSCGGSGLGMRRKQTHQEDQPNLNEALLESKAEILSANAFQRKQQDVSAVQNGDWQQIQNPKIDTHAGHQQDHRHWTPMDRISGRARNLDDSMELPHRKASAEKSSSDTENSPRNVCRIAESNSQPFVE